MPLPCFGPGDAGAGSSLFRTCPSGRPAQDTSIGSSASSSPLPICSIVASSAAPSTTCCFRLREAASISPSAACTRTSSACRSSSDSSVSFGPPTGLLCLAACCFGLGLFHIFCCFGLGRRHHFGSFQRRRHHFGSLRWRRRRFVNRPPLWHDRFEHALLGGLFYGRVGVHLCDF